MNFKTASYGGTVEILAADTFTAIPITIKGSDVMKAGQPVTASGTKAASSMADAAGILLYDVDPTKNPNGAMVVAGVIDAKKAAKNAGITLGTTEITALKASVPGVVFRTNI